MRALVVGLVVCASPLVHAASLTRGPVLQQNDTDSAVIVVELDRSAAIEVRFGTAPTYGKKVSLPSSARHEIVLEGLDPDTRYDYSIWADGQEISTGHSLWTAVDPGAPFRFVLYGDTRTHADVHMDVVEAIRGEAANVLVHTGDLVNDGRVASEWDEFFAIEAPLLSQVPMFPVVGNHEEYHTGDAALYRQAFTLPNNELYYSFDYGNTHFLVVDGEVRIESSCTIEDASVVRCFDSQQMAWIRSDLAAAVRNPTIDHIFVLAHEGPYTSKSGREGSMALRALMPLFRDYGVTAVLSGHDHYYERGESPQGIPYIISGGGGAPLYDIGSPSPDPHTVHVNAKTHHYVVFDLIGTTAEVTVKGLDGRIIDQVTWTARPPDCARIYCGPGESPGDPPFVHEPRPRPLGQPGQSGHPAIDVDQRPQPPAPVTASCSASGSGSGAVVVLLAALAALVGRRRRV